MCIRDSSWTPQYVNESFITSFATTDTPANILRRNEYHMAEAMLAEAEAVMSLLIAIYRLESRGIIALH